MNKDLRAVAEKVEQLLQEELGLDERPAFAITLALPPSYKEARWVTNVERADGILMMESTVERMKAQHN